MTLYDEINMHMETLTNAWDVVHVSCANGNCYVSDALGHEAYGDTLLDALREAVKKVEATASEPKMGQALLDRFAAAYNIAPTEKAVLALAHTHGYACNCDLCLFWFATIGPDESTGKYGPFTEDEIAQARAEMV